MTRAEHRARTPSGGATARILVVEDHWVWADAVVHRINSMSGVECVGVAENGAEALRLAAEVAPHVALVDLMLGDESGLPLGRTLLCRHPGLRVVIVTVEPTPAAIAEAREAGMAGFVCKDDLMTGAQVEVVLGAVSRGDEVWSASVAALESRAAAGAEYGLSDEDVAIIRCFARGFGTMQTSRLVFLAPQTIRNRTTAIGRRLGVSGRLEIVAAAYERGIIDPPERPVIR